MVDLVMTVRHWLNSFITTATARVGEWNAAGLSTLDVFLLIRQLSHQAFFLPVLIFLLGFITVHCFDRMMVVDVTLLVSLLAPGLLGSRWL
jgi:hypothetical protein